MLNLMEIFIKEDVISVVQESSFNMDCAQENVDLISLIEIEFACVILDLLEMEINVSQIKLARIINYSGMEHAEDAQVELAYQMIKKTCECRNGRTYDINTNTCNLVCGFGEVLENDRCVCARNFGRVGGVCQQCPPGATSNSR